MRHACPCVLLLLAAALAGLASEAPKPPDNPPPATTPAAGQRLVVIQSKTPLMFGNEVIGQLAERTRLELVQSHDAYSLVRTTFGDNWFQGWVRTSLTLPDSLENVDVKVGMPKRTYLFEGVTPPPGTQFLELRVRFTATPKSPSLVYLDLGEGDKADVYVTYGRDRRVPVHGFMRQAPSGTRRVFERTDKQQTLILKPGETVEEAYVFAVPVRAEDFNLVLKDVTRPIRSRP